MVAVKHRIWIQAPPRAVRAQFADLRHHIEANVHPKLKFEVLAHAMAAPVVLSPLEREVAAEALENKCDLAQRGFRPREPPPA